MAYKASDIAKIQLQVGLVEQAPYILVFNKPRSANWPIVKEVCQKHCNFLEKNGLSFAMFDSSVLSLRTLNNILRLTSGWSSMFLFIDGEHEEHYRLAGWLSCYIQSFHLENTAAYCLETIYTGEQYRYLAPCRLLHSYNISELHPAPLVDQIKAMAVQQGVFRCPNFHAENLRR